MTIIDKIKRLPISVESKIKKYLDVLDNTEDFNVEIYKELYKLYMHLEKLHISLSFANKIKDIDEKANSFWNEYNRKGNIDLEFIKYCNKGHEGQNKRNILTSSNARYFPILLNLIGSIHKNSYNYNIYVLDLGMFEWQIDCVSKISNVYIIKDQYTFDFFKWKFDFVNNFSGKSFLYLDAGCSVNKDLSYLFDYIDNNGFLIFNHFISNDNLLNKWTSKVVYDTFDIDKSKDRSITPISTIFGISDRFILDEMTKYNIEYNLRPHSDCIDNRFDQSLFGVLINHVLKLNKLKFEDYLLDCHNNGSDDPFITIHRSKFYYGDTYRYILLR